MCQPEVRRAKQNLLIKERISPRDMFHQPAVLQDTLIESLAPPQNHPIHSPSVLPSHHPPTPRRSTSPKFKLTVKNVDDPGGNFKKTTPKFGRRSIGGGGSGVKDAHRLRNRTKVVEGNREYTKGVRMTNVQSDGGGRHHHKTKPQRSIVDPQSFVVLKEPCKPSNWMKSSWYA